LDARGNVANKNEEKAEVLNAFFEPQSLLDWLFPAYSAPSAGRQEGEWNKTPIIQEEAVNDLLCHLDTYKSTGPDRIHQEC